MIKDVVFICKLRLKMMTIDDSALALRWVMFQSDSGSILAQSRVNCRIQAQISMTGTVTLIASPADVDLKHGGLVTQMLSC